MQPTYRPSNKHCKYPSGPYLKPRLSYLYSLPAWPITSRNKNGSFAACLSPTMPLLIIVYKVAYNVDPQVVWGLFGQNEVAGAKCKFLLENA